MTLGVTIFELSDNSTASTTTKKSSKFLVPGVCWGNPTMANEFSSQKAGFTEIVPMWWRHHVLELSMYTPTGNLQLFDRRHRWSEVRILWTTLACVQAIDGQILCYLMKARERSLDLSVYLSTPFTTNYTLPILKIHLRKQDSKQVVVDNCGL